MNLCHVFKFILCGSLVASCSNGGTGVRIDLSDLEHHAAQSVFVLDKLEIRIFMST